MKKLILLFEIALNFKIISKRSISIQKRGQSSVRLAGCGFHLDYDRLCDVSMPLHFVVFLVGHHAALLVVFRRGGVPRRLLLQRARRVLVLVLVCAVFQLVVVCMRLHLRRVRCHHWVISHTQRWRTSFPILVGMPRRKHLSVVAVQHSRVRVGSWLSVEAGVAATAGREQVVRGQFV